MHLLGAEATLALEGGGILLSKLLVDLGALGRLVAVGCGLLVLLKYCCHVYM